MAISKERKKALVSQYKDLLNNSSALILTTYSGLNVSELEELRRNIGEVGGRFHIVKNNLVERAFSEVGMPLPGESLVGPTAIGFAAEDVIGVAKAIVDLSKESDFMQVKGGVIEGEIHDASQIRRLAELPPMPVVQAQLLSVLQAPARKIAVVMAGPARSFVNVFKAYSESGAA